MIRAGADPELLDEVIWWQSDDLWVSTLDALAVYVRVVGDRTGFTVAEVCERHAQRHGVDLGTPNSRLACAAPFAPDSRRRGAQRIQ